MTPKWRFNLQCTSYAKMDPVFVPDRTYLILQCKYVAKVDTDFVSVFMEMCV